MSSSAFCVHCHSNWFPATTNSNGKPKLIRPGLPPHLNDVWWCEIWFVTWQQQTYKKPVVELCWFRFSKVLSRSNWPNFITNQVYMGNQRIILCVSTSMGRAECLSICLSVCVCMCDICKYLNKHIDIHIKPWLMIEISNNRCLYTLHGVIE